MQATRVTVFAGHYGSGKTSLAVNYAMALRTCRERVILCDLDIVNPYFRTADALSLLNERGVELVTSQFAGTNVDAPAMPARTQMIFDDPAVTAVIDVGGDDRGALALGRYSASLRAADHEMLLVINQYRPLTRDLDGLREIRAEIEAAARVPFTGIVNNSNLGSSTTLADVAATLDFALETAGALGLPLRMTAIRADLLLPPRGDDDMIKMVEDRTTVFPIQIFTKTDWQL